MDKGTVEVMKIVFANPLNITIAFIILAAVGVGIIFVKAWFKNPTFLGKESCKGDKCVYRNISNILSDQSNELVGHMQELKEDNKSINLKLAEMERNNMQLMKEVSENNKDIAHILTTLKEDTQELKIRMELQQKG